MDTNQATYTPERKYDIIYALSIITSVILAGVSEAAIKCEKFKGPPLCIQQGGATRQGSVQRQGQGPAQGQRQGPAQGQQQQQGPGQMQPEINSIWLNSFMNLVGVINDKLNNIFENVSINAINTVEKYTIGDLGTKQLDKKLLEELQIKSMILGKMTRDPEVQKAMKDMAEELSIISIQMLDTMKPAIDRLTDRAIDTLNRTTSKGSKAIMNTGMNIIEALLGEIPVAGGIIALVMAFMRGFNMAMLTAAPGVELSTDEFFTALHTSIKMAQDFVQSQKKINNDINALKTSIENIIPSASDINAFANKGQELGNAYALNEVKSPFVGVKTPFEGVKSPFDGVKSPLIDVKNPLSAANPLSSVKNPLSVANPLSDVKKPLSKANPLKKVKQDGGRAKIQRKIQHITKRLKNTINTFTNNNILTNKRLTNKRLTKKLIR